MLLYDCMKRLWSLAATIADIFCLAPTARTKQRQSEGVTFSPTFPSFPASAWQRQLKVSCLFVSWATMSGRIHSSIGESPHRFIVTYKVP